MAFERQRRSTLQKQNHRRGGTVREGKLMLPHCWTQGGTYVVFYKRIIDQLPKQETIYRRQYKIFFN